MKRLIIVIWSLSVILAGCGQRNAAPPTPTNTQPVDAASVNAPAPAALTSAEPTQFIVPVATVISEPTPTTPPAVSSEGPCDNPYYPIVDGATWVYETEEMGPATHTMATGQDNTFTVTVESENSTSTLAGTCTDEGIVLMDQGLGGSFQSDSGTSTVTTQYEDGITLPDDIQVGDDWSQTMSLIASSGDQSLSAEIVTNYKALGYESVTVPAGTFEALKIEQTGTMNMMGQEILTKGMLWYAQGVGSVKSESGLEGEKASIIQLLSYSIP